jgi:F-type H+-transporting ATPase subunit b
MSIDPSIIEQAAAVAEAQEAVGGLGTLGINFKIFIAQLVNFGIVLFVLKKFAFGPITKALDERSAKIAAGLKQAADAEARVAKIEAERADVVAAAKKEAMEILVAARADAEVVKQDMVEKAKREVERVVVQGKAQLKTEGETMLRDMRKDIVELAVDATRKILNEAIDEKKATSLAEEVVRKMT